MNHDSIAELSARLGEFAEARDWERYHTPKNLSMALVVEAGELVELFQWMTPEESVQAPKDPETRAAIASEIADVAIYLLRLADVVGVGLGEAVGRKIEVNEERFPRVPDLPRRPSADSQARSIKEEPHGP